MSFSSYENEESRSLLPFSSIDDNLKVYKRRWFQLFIFSMGNMLVAVYQFSFSGIQGPMMTIYNRSTNEINALGFIVTCGYAIFSIFSMYILSRSTRKGIVLGSLFLLVAAWIRYLGADYFWALVVGQGCSSVAMACYSNAVTNVAESWFPANQRSDATAIGAMANVVGGAVAFGLSAAFVDDHSTNIYNLLLAQALITTVICLSLVVFFKSSPPIPPSISAAEHKLATPPPETLIGYFTEIQKCLVCCHFNLLLMGIAIVYGSFTATMLILDQILSSVGLSEDQTSVCALLLMGTGIISCGISAPLLDKYRDYKSFLLVGLFLYCCSMIGFNLSLMYQANVYVIGTFCGLIGATALPCLPTALEMAVEVTFPVSESISNGIMLILGNVSAFVLTLVMTAFQKPDGSMTNSIWFVFSICAVCVPSLGFIHPVYKRVEEEKHPHLDNIQYNHHGHENGNGQEQGREREREREDIIVESDHQPLLK